jgi:hypothetical protein
MRNFLDHRGNGCRHPVGRGSSQASRPRANRLTGRAEAMRRSVVRVWGLSEEFLNRFAGRLTVPRPERTAKSVRRESALAPIQGSGSSFCGLRKLTIGRVSPVLCEGVFQKSHENGVHHFVRSLSLCLQLVKFKLLTWLLPTFFSSALSVLRIATRQHRAGEETEFPGCPPRLPSATVG